MRAEIILQITLSIYFASMAAIHTTHTYIYTYIDKLIQ